MIQKRLTLLIIFFISITISAQEDSIENQLITSSNIHLNVSNNLQTYSFDNDELSISTIENNATNFMLANAVDTAKISEELNMEYPFKRRKHPLEKTGRILTYVGVPLAIIGGILVAGADELSYQCVNGDCTGDARGGFGVVMLAAGVGLSGTGAVLWVIGSKK